VRLTINTYTFSVNDGASPEAPQYAFRRAIDPDELSFHFQPYRLCHVLSILRVPVPRLSSSDACALFAVGPDLCDRLSLYRLSKESVMDNLRHAFPEKTEVERIRIAKKFYHNFIDSFVEVIKL